MPGLAWRERGAAESALRAVEDTLRRTPDGLDQLFARACLLDLLGRVAAAQQAYLDVLARDFGHAGALANLGALFVRQGYRQAARTTYQKAVTAHPDDPAAHVNLANLLREGDAAASEAHYRRALALDASFADAHRGLSYLLEAVDPEAAAHHRDLGFATQPLFTSLYRGVEAPTRVLHLVSARGDNTPLQAVLDDRFFLTHTLAVEYAAAVPLPPHDVVVNAIGDADQGGEALRIAARLTAGGTARVINQPARVLQTSRAANLARLGRLDGVRTPRTALVPRGELGRGRVPDGFRCPFLLRSPGFHTGQHFHKIASPEQLDGALRGMPGDVLLALEYLDARGADGASRKYRVMLIGGRILPLHLAISSEWMVHYFSSDMRLNAAYRHEEAAFLQGAAATLGPVAMRGLQAIGEVLALEYCGVDFALEAGGRILLFEANATMALVDPGGDPAFAYRRPAFERALAAAQALLRTPADHR